MHLNNWAVIPKRMIIVLASLGFLALTGCMQDLAQPSLDTAGLEYNEIVPLNDDFDTCLGERVTIIGTQHIVGRFTNDKQGRFHFGFTRNTHGTGIGQVSGAKYLLTDTVNRTSLEVTGEPRVFLEQYQGHLMRVGSNSSDDDALLHFLSKITIDANGNVSSSVELEKAECK